MLGALETVALLVGVALLGTSWLQSRPLPADVAEPRTAHAVQLVVGNCLADLPPDGDVDTVRVVPCDGPHTARVASSYAFSADAIWPGQGDADALVARSCVLTADEQAVGRVVVTWAPTEQSWDRGDRTGLCVVVTPAG
ncbi:septum formation family protein [Cellulomonas sp. DKR-3]|uniref:Septum formation family protein n=1 Tax=Cellulomonas fulva TaxID=2835530 RepID=A0ABS5TVV6_9CELL|nr:septum formation family protein [Cellulomonas fulva]